MEWVVTYVCFRWRELDVIFGHSSVLFPTTSVMCLLFWFRVLLNEVRDV